MEAGIDPGLICSRLWKASPFYTPDLQTVCYSKKNYLNKNNKINKVLRKKKKKKGLPD